MTWTHFWDMHSGGRQKLDWAHIYIQAPEEEAKLIFYNLFGRNPERITCSCCGEDYAIDSEDGDYALEYITAFHRGAKITETDDLEEPILDIPQRPSFGYRYQTLLDFMISDEAKFINQEEISAHPEWLVGSVPEEGWRWT